MIPIEMQEKAIQIHQTVITTTDNKKEQERNELHRTIWAIADEMRSQIIEIIKEL